MELDPERGFGFLLSSDGAEVYFHRNSLLGGKFESLSVGSKVAFVEEQATRARRRAPFGWSKKRSGELRPCTDGARAGAGRLSKVA